VAIRDQVHFFLVDIYRENIYQVYLEHQTFPFEEDMLQFERLVSNQEIFELLLLFPAYDAENEASQATIASAYPHPMQRDSEIYCQYVTAQKDFQGL
jgi:hypothetical protein